MRHKPELDHIINAPADQVKILKALRQLIHGAFSEITEDFKWGIPVFRKTKNFTYLRSAKHHVGLGFYNIEKINHPNGLLEVKGKTMKHLRIRKLEDINQKLIIEWLKLTIE